MSGRILQNREGGKCLREISRSEKDKNVSREKFRAVLPSGETKWFYGYAVTAGIDVIQACSHVFVGNDVSAFVQLDACLFCFSDLK